MNTHWYENTSDKSTPWKRENKSVMKWIRHVLLQQSKQSQHAKQNESLNCMNKKKSRVKKTVAKKPTPTKSATSRPNIQKQQSAIVTAPLIANQRAVAHMVHGTVALDRKPHDLAQQSSEESLIEEASWRTVLLSKKKSSHVKLEPVESTSYAPSMTAEFCPSSRLDLTDIDGPPIQPSKPNLFKRSWWNLAERVKSVTFETVTVGEVLYPPEVVVCEMYWRWIEGGDVIVNVIPDHETSGQLNIALRLSTPRNDDGKDINPVLGRHYTRNTLTMARFKLGDLLMYGQLQGDAIDWVVTLKKEDADFRWQCQKTEERLLRQRDRRRRRLSEVFESNSDISIYMKPREELTLWQRMGLFYRRNIGFLLDKHFWTY